MTGSIPPLPPPDVLVPAALLPPPPFVPLPPLVVLLLPAVPLSTPALDPLEVVPAFASPAPALLGPRACSPQAAVTHTRTMARACIPYGPTGPVGALPLNQAISSSE